MHVAAHRVLLVDNHDARRDSSTVISGSGSQNCEDLLCRSHWFSTSVGIWSSDWSSDWSSPWPFGGLREVIPRLIPFFGWFLGTPGDGIGSRIGLGEREA